MRSTATRSSGLALALVAGWAWAHPQGFHKKLTVTVARQKVSALVVMDVDSGERCLLLRGAVDADRDGRLEGDEVAKLKERLVKLASSRLEVKLSGAPLALTLRETKLSLREDRRANDAALSVALLYELALSSPVGEGMTLEVSDVAPDQSHVAVQVFQAGAKAAPFQQEVPSGTPATVRLGRLAEE
jgi:hypothetical protein